MNQHDDACMCFDCIAHKASLGQRSGEDRPTPQQFQNVVNELKAVVEVPGERVNLEWIYDPPERHGGKTVHSCVLATVYPTELNDGRTFTAEENAEIIRAALTELRSEAAPRKDVVHDVAQIQHDELGSAEASPSAVDLSSGEVMWRLQRAIDLSNDETRPGLLAAHNVIGDLVISLVSRRERDQKTNEGSDPQSGRRNPGSQDRPAPGTISTAGPNASPVRRVFGAKAPRCSFISEHGTACGLNLHHAEPHNAAPADDGPWRVGRKLGRTVYCGERFEALFDRPEIADLVVTKMNRDWNETGYTANVDASPSATPSSSPVPESWAAGLRTHAIQECVDHLYAKANEAAQQGGTYGPEKALWYDRAANELCVSLFTCKGDPK